MKSDRSVGFTLIEVLMALAVIVILAASLMTGIAGVRQRGLKVKGSAVAKNVATALCSYYNEYGRWPFTAASTNVDAQLFEQLLGPKTLGSREYNPKGINFLNLSKSQLSFTNSLGQLLDPWHNPYVFQLDPGGMLGSGVIDPMGTLGNLRTPAVVWSVDNKGVCKTQSW